MGAEYKVHTKLLTEFETLGVMGENNSGIKKTKGNSNKHNAELQRKPSPEN